MSARAHDLTGRVFGRLTAIRQEPNGKSGNTRWLCRCECGLEKVFYAGNLVRGLTRSCGCLHREIQFKHGLAGTREYKTWHGMVARCNDPENVDYPKYGGRGIRVCDRWLSLENFLADMGPRPVGTTLDRIDNNKGYAPGNCRWATASIQMNNTRATRLLTHAGETLSISQWARKTGIERMTLTKRLKRGWSVERALTAPVEEQPWH